MTTYFFDRTFSPKLSQILSVLGVSTVAHKEMFPPDTEDAVWLPRLQGTGYVIVTGDNRIRSKRAEAAALASVGLTALFYFPSFSNWGLWRQAGWLTANWPETSKAVEDLRQGACARVRPNGAVEVLVMRMV